MAQSIPYEAFAEVFCKEAISKFSSADWREVIKEGRISQDDKRIEWEVFYLWLFLLTYCFQRKFAYLGKEKIKIVLDGIHKAIYSPTQHPDISKDSLRGLHDIIVIRYTQYYRTIKSDWEIMKKGAAKLPFSALVNSFVANLLNISIEDFDLHMASLLNIMIKDFESQDFSKFTKFQVKFGLIISYFCREN